MTKYGVTFTLSLLLNDRCARLWITFIFTDPVHRAVRFVLMLSSADCLSYPEFGAMPLSRLMSPDVKYWTVGFPPRELSDVS